MPPSPSPSRRTNGRATANGASGSSSSGPSSARATPVSLSLDSNLHSSLAHLPPSVHAALVARDIPPQNIVLQLTRLSNSKGHDNAGNSDDDNDGNDNRETTRNTIFLGWSGHSSNIDSTLTLAAPLTSLFHPPAQLTPSSSYTLTLLRSPPLPTASRVDLTPLTPDDWELLSQNAGAVEDNMLSQVRAVTRGARLCIFVGSGGAAQQCWFSVDSSDPRTDSTTTTTTTTNTNTANTANAATHPRAVRLTTDTEVVIAPRTRQSAAEAAARQSHSLNPAESSYASAQVNRVLEARKALKNRLYKVLPPHYPQPRLVPGLDVDLDSDVPLVVYGQEDQDGQDDQDWRLIAQAFASSTDSHRARLTISVQPCPSAQSLRPRESATAHSAKTKSKGKNQAAAAAAAAEQSAQDRTPNKPTAVTHIFKGQGLPSRWVWTNDALRRKLGGVGTGETVCFSAPPPGAATKEVPPAAAAAAATSTYEPPQLAGVQPLLASLHSQLTTSLSSSAFSPSASHASSPASSNILLHGPSGVGKTSILRALAARLEQQCTTTLYVDCTPLAEMRTSQLRDVFREWRDAADWYAHAPRGCGSGSGTGSGSGSVLFLDNLDKVIVPEVENVDPSRARTLAERLVQAMLDPRPGSPANAIVVATASSSSSLHALLAEKHFWNESVGVKPPGKGERAEILAHLIRLKAQASQASQQRGQGDDADAAQANAIVPDASLNYAQLASETEGYLPTDLVDLVDRAIYRAAVRLGGEDAKVGHAATQGNGHSHGSAHTSPPLKLSAADFTSAQENFTPLSLRSLSLSTSSVSWSSIGGLHDTRRVLRETLEFPARYAQIFASCPLRLRSGLLLYGYPGCGKTMLASAVARECGANFVSVKGPELLNKYIGASEKSVRDLFERASAAKPCVLFFDEFDSIAPKRGHDSTGVTDRVVNQLLTQMDGAEGLDGVYVLAATSRPDLIDAALLRPGRLDKSLLCDMPAHADRVDILRAVAREGNIHVAEDVQWGEWADKTEGYSGADLQAFLYNAHLEVIHEGISGGANKGEGDAPEDKSQAKEQGASTRTLRFVEVAPRQADSNSSASASASTTTSTSTPAPKRSGAEEQALRRRLELALRNSLGRGPGASLGPAGDPAPAPAPARVTSSHLSRSLASMRASVPLSERRRLQAIYADFAGDSAAERERARAQGKGKGRPADFGTGEGSRDVGVRESLM